MTEQPTEPKRVIHEVCGLIPDGAMLLSAFGDDAAPGDVVVIASVTMFEHETYDPPAWVVHGVETKGWWIRHRPAQPTGLTFHGAVDWRSVAEVLAAAMRRRKSFTKAEVAALDTYGIAMAEEALAEDDPEDGSE